MKIIATTISTGIYGERFFILEDLASTSVPFVEVLHTG